ncbi:MAG TPA: hypothetical protein VKI62_03215 [Bacteroidota bacterium]|nr:hypothetical protein [Bacteroidota bacterium]
MKQTFILFLFLIVLNGCQAPKQEVVAILKTRTYHTEQCAKICMAQTTIMTLEKARSLKLNPCPYCKPAGGL